MKPLTKLAPVVVLVVAGCIGTTPPSRFYTLTPEIGGAEQDTIEIVAETVGVGPFNLPRYLRRPQMVVRADGNELVIDEFARWADALDLQFQRIVAQNVRGLSRCTHVLSFPWRQEFKPSLRVIGDVTRFEADTAGQVRLEIHWGIVRLSDEAVISAHEDVFVGTADASSPASIATAMSGLLADFSRAAAAGLAAAAAQSDFAGAGRPEGC
jgi:uncharacterized lipoprotein YmbA